MSKLRAIINEINIKNFIKNHKTFVINLSLLLVVMSYMQWAIYGWEQSEYFALVSLAAPSFLLLVTFSTWSVLNHWWNKHIKKDVYLNTETNLIKSPCLPKILFFFIIIQSFWVVYWFNNLPLLGLIGLMCVISEYSYKVKYPKDYVIKFSNEPNVQFVFDHIKQSKSILSKMKLINFDLPAAVRFENFGTIMMVLIFIFIMFRSGFSEYSQTDKLGRPLTNLKILQFNYTKNIPAFNEKDLILLKNTPFQLGRIDGRHGVWLVVDVVNYDKFYISRATRKSFNQLLSIEKVYKLKGKADIWIDPNTGYLLQIIGKDNTFKIMYQDFLAGWLAWHNSLRAVFAWGTAIILCCFLFDYFLYFYLKRYYYGEERA